MSQSPVAVDQIRRDLDDVLARIVEKQQDLDDRVASLRADEEQARVLHQLLALAEIAYGEEPSVEAVAKLVAVPDKEHGPKDLAGMDAIDAMAAVLAAADRPMTLPEIASAMLAAGWRTKAKVPVDTLRVALRRDTAGQIVREGRGLYRLGTAVPWDLSLMLSKTEKEVG